MGTAGRPRSGGPSTTRSRSSRLPYGIGGFVTLEQVTDAPPSVSPETPLVEVLEAMADARPVTVRRGVQLLGVIEHDRLLAVLRAAQHQLQSSVRHAA